MQGGTPYSMLLLETGGLVPPGALPGYETQVNWLEFGVKQIKGQGIAILARQVVQVLGVLKSICFVTLALNIPN